jgi:hypothetical protein
MPTVPAPATNRNPHTTTPNRPQAAQFIELLTGNPETSVTFQTFDDSGAKRKRLVAMLHGSLSTHWDALVALNDKGAGIFVTVNATDLQGRLAKNITAVRANVADFDLKDGHKAPEKWPLQPSILVKSGGGFHAYWLREPNGTPNADQYREQQKRIAHTLGTDPRVSDLPRVFRLPGSLHRKQDPIAVEVIHAAPQNTYNATQVEQAFPPIPDPQITKAATILADVWTKGIRHDASMALAGALARVGWPIEETLSFVALICDLAEASSHHEADVRDTYKKHASDGIVTGWNALRELTSKTVVKNTRSALGELVIPRDLPKIWIDIDEYRMADEAEAALASKGAIYQRGGQLVRVLQDDDGAPTIKAFCHASLRERLTACARFIRPSGSDGEITMFPPPQPIVAEVLARGRWSQIPVLTSVCDFPVLTPSGVILDSPGYDPETQLYMQPSITPAMPSSLDDAVRELLEPIDEFPFSPPQSATCVLSAVLSLLARPAIDGPIPLHVFDSNAPGTGKGLLASIVAIIVTGRPLPPGPQTEDEEFRKRIFGVLESGTPIASIDDVKRPLGGGALDRLLTAWPSYSDRRLGVNETVTLPARCVWIATGANVEIADHTLRRVVIARLDTPLERPEERDDFRHKSILEYTRTHRAQLLGAALFVLKAYVDAGRPDQGLRPLGSFESWGLVRNALVFAGLPDPVAAKAATTSSDSGDRGAAAALLAPPGLPAIIEAHGEDYGQQRGIAAAGIMRALGSTGLATIGEPPFPAVREALDQLVRKELTAQRIGYALRRLKGRVIGGHTLLSVRNRLNVTLWCVQEC